ncbi:hypothetical protein JCM33374_g4388 [Metschnikowia sp. JCM 33374]|nr:hypothetical protein JCM33374_g4388 [Metschnikowia sp. JCM 33374]
MYYDHSPPQKWGQSFPSETKSWNHIGEQHSSIQYASQFRDGIAMAHPAGLDNIDLLRIPKNTHNSHDISQQFLPQETSRENSFENKLDPKWKIKCYEPIAHSNPTLSACSRKFSIGSPTKGPGVGSFSKPPSSLVNFHEILRCFLAIKIIFSSIKKSEGSSLGQSAIPRGSVYKVYVILCQRLLQSSSNVSKYTAESLVLGHSAFGKLTNLIHPDHVTRRLGKRGNSKYHYIGLTWNRATVDDDTLQLAELEVQKIRQHSKKCLPISDNKHNQNKGAEDPLTKPRELSETSSRRDISTTLTNGGQTFITPNCIPQQSKWAKDNTERSLVVLRDYGVELSPLITNFNSGCFSHENPDSLPKSVYHAMLKLQAASASREIYLHLYFIIMVMILPVVIASDTEVGATSKHHFRQAVNTCVAIIESDINNLSIIDEPSLKIFLAILKKMAHLSEMSSCKIKTPYTHSILEEVITRLEFAVAKEPNDFTNLSSIETMYIRSIMVSMNAYNFNVVEPDEVNSDAVADSISSLASLLRQTAIKSKGEIQKIPHLKEEQGTDYMAQDIPHKVLHIVLKNFHEVTLSKPLFLKLPMAIFTSILSGYGNWIQTDSLTNFKKVDADFAKEGFRFSWFFSSMYHEYIKILSEVVALNETLTETCAARMR